MDREEVRAKIVRKASEEILARGYTRVTMDQIATGLGMSKKTLYRVFPGKREMLQVVLAELTREIEKGLADLVAREGLSFVERLHELMLYTARQYARFGQGFVEDLRQSEPRVWQELETFRDELVQRYFLRIVREGTAVGAFNAGIDPRVLGMVYIAAVRGVLNPRALLELQAQPEQAYADVFRLLFEGMLGDEARASYRESLRADAEA